MSYSLQGAAFAMTVIAAVGGYSVVNRTANFTPAVATVSTIDRSCDIIETTYDSNYKRKASRIYRGSCSDMDDWQEVRSKRKKDISGKAVIHLTYTAPQNGQWQSGKLEFTGRDEEFYKLKAGDEVKILVSKSDPTKILKA